MGHVRTVAAVAAGNFLIQGVVWTILALLGILAYTCHFTPKDDATDRSFTAMAKMYFTDSSCWKVNEELKSMDLTSSSQKITLISLQFIFNFLLSVVSLVLIFIIPRSSSYLFVLWTYILIFIWAATAVLDFVTAATFDSDKDVISTGTSTTSLSHALIDMLLLVALVSIRGYLYWCINCLLIIYLLVACSMRLFKACKKLDDMKQERSEGTVNPAFEVDEQGYPMYTARSRWPWLGVPLWRRQQLSMPKSPSYRDQLEQRERAGFGNREPLENTNIQDHLNRSYNDILSDTARARYRREDWQRRETPDFLRRESSLPRRQETPQPEEKRNTQSKENVENAQIRSAYERQFVPRPNSLHEAILTLKPLRQVRPKIPDMQRY